MEGVKCIFFSYFTGSDVYILQIKQTEIIIILLFHEQIF